MSQKRMEGHGEKDGYQPEGGESEQEKYPTSQMGARCAK